MDEQDEVSLEEILQTKNEACNQFKVRDDDLVFILGDEFCEKLKGKYVIYHDPIPCHDYVDKLFGVMVVHLPGKGVFCTRKDMLELFAAEVMRGVYPLRSKEAPDESGAR